MPIAILDPGGAVGDLTGKLPGMSSIENFYSRLLFFDKFVVPVVAIHDPMSLQKSGQRPLVTGKEIEFLFDNDLIHSAYLTSPFHEISVAMVEAQENVASGKVTNSQFDPDGPKLFLDTPDVFIPERFSTASKNKDLCLAIEFVDGIPIPHRKTTPEKVLAFRERHQNEYRAFWDTVFEIGKVSSWTNSEDPLTEIKTEILSRLNDCEIFADNTWGKRLRDRVKYRLALDENSIKSLIASGTFELLNSPSGIVISLAVAGVVRISVENSQRPKSLNQGTLGMSYISKIRRWKGSKWR